MTTSKSRFGARRFLTGIQPLGPLGNPVQSPYWFLANVPQALWDRERHAWSYEVDFDPLFGGQTLVKFIPIQEGAGFLLTALAGLLVDTENPPVFFAATQITNILIQLEAVKSRRPLFSGPVPLDTVASIQNPGSPGIPVPTFFENGEVISVTAISLWSTGTAINRTLRLSLHGGIISS